METDDTTATTTTSATTASAAARGREAWIASQKGWLVRQGNKIGEQAGARKDWASQGRGLWEACRHETEPEVILNLLRYQACRVDSWEGVSGLLEADIHECCRLAQAAGATGDAMELIRLLLLYALRAHKYQASLGSPGSPGSPGKGKKGGKS